MLTKEEQELLDQQGVQDELNAIQEQKKAQNQTAILPQKWIKGLVFILIMSLIVIGVGALMIFNGVTNSRLRIDGFPVLALVGALVVFIGLIWTIVALRGLAKKKAKFGRSIMVAPDGEIPDFPEETIAKAPVIAPIRIDEDRPMAIKKIYADDPEKRIIKMDKKKVERVLDHNITFPKLAAAFRANLAADRLNVPEEDAKALIGALAFSRLLFIQGVAKEHQEAVVHALSYAMATTDTVINGSGPALKDYVHNRIPMNLEPNQGFVVGIVDLDFGGVSSFFEGYDGLVTDYSAHHPLQPSGTFSMNLIFLVFLPDGPFHDIPASLMEKSSLLSLAVSPLPEEAPNSEKVAVRSTGDEIRYLALREKSRCFLTDEAIRCMDGAFSLAEKKGHPLHNDVENALEREEAALLLMGFTPERVAGIAFAQSYLPYLLSVLEPAAITEEGGLREVIENSFSDEESSIPARAAFRRLHSTVKKGGTAK